MIGWIGNSYSGSYGEKDLGRNGYRGCKGIVDVRVCSGQPVLYYDIWDF